MKASAYDSVTWESAMNIVASRSSATADYHRTRVLLEYFVNEEHAFSSLEVFLCGLDDAVDNLREYENRYRITAEARADLREKCDRCLTLLAAPADEQSAYAVYQLQIDRVFTCATLEDLLSSVTELSRNLRRWFPAAYPEAHLISDSAQQITVAANLLKAPVTLGELSEMAGSDFTPLSAVLHRFVATGNFSVAKRGRRNTYAFATNAVDVNALRWEWAWLWALPHKRLTFKTWRQWLE